MTNASPRFLVSEIAKKTGFSPSPVSRVKSLLLIGFAAILSTPAAQSQTTAPVDPQTHSVAAPRDKTLFDYDWKFQLGDPANASDSAFDDSAWRKLDLPHDWMIEGVAGPDPASMDGPFDRKSPAGGGGAYLNGGIGWYRKTFSLPESMRAKRVAILFDGAYMDSDVYLNGQKLGNHPYGYSSFWYDLTPGLKFGAEKNVIAVRLNVQQPCSRFYSGAGIYRHVWLVSTEPVHVAPWGTYITTPKAAAHGSEVHVSTTVNNDSAGDQQVTLTTVLLDPSGHEAGRKEETKPIAGSASIEFSQDITLPSATLWSLHTPELYHALSEVRVGGSLTDSYTTSFGIRSIEFRKDEGFFLNGERVQIQGVCDHHDLGCLGSAAYERGIERQLQILKGMGCNAIRTSHNPPAPELLDLCDRMGFLVMDECFDEWKAAKRKMGYSRFFNQWWDKDLGSMIERDRNHPSIVLWSIGNEVQEGYKPGGEKVAAMLHDFVHEKDPTRPVTDAANKPFESFKTGFDRSLDILGINYSPAAYQSQDLRAQDTMIGSETASTVDARSDYGLRIDNDEKVSVDSKDRVSSYDIFFPVWATDAQQEELYLHQAPWIAGEFVWTGFDYLGEPTPYGWPSRSSYFGILDLCGFPKDRYYLYKSLWSSEPVVHLMPMSWTWPGFEGKNIPVWVYTNADSVELFLNGQSLGEKKFPADCETVSVKALTTGDVASKEPNHPGPSLHLAWSVPYAPGTLKAVAKKNGQVIATDELATAGDPARLVLEADRDHIDATGQDLAYIKLTVVDKDGHVCPDADNEITFSVDGSAAVLAGVDNGDSTNHESFQGAQHKAYHGLALAVLKSKRDVTGSVKLTASAEGLPTSTVEISVQSPKPDAQK